MRYLIALIIIFILPHLSMAQSASRPLPVSMYAIMRDSTTSIDIVFLQGEGKSISVDGKNARTFSSFFENTVAQKDHSLQVGMIMWQVHGKEFLSGNFYLGEKTGYVIINKDGKEYVNLINEQGNSFFKNQLKQ
jgi:hypothetical protein